VLGDKREGERERKKYRGKTLYLYTEKPFILCRGTLGQAVWRSRHYICVYNTQHISQSDAMYIYKYSRVTPEPSVYIYICVGV